MMTYKRAGVLAILFGLLAIEAPSDAEAQRGAGLARAVRAASAARRAQLAKNAASAGSNPLGRGPRDPARARRAGRGSQEVEIDVKLDRGNTRLPVGARFHGVSLVENTTTTHRAVGASRTVTNSFNVPEVVPGVRQTIVPGRNGRAQLRVNVSPELQASNPGLVRQLRANRGKLLVDYATTQDGRFQATFRSEVRQGRGGLSFTERTVEVAPQRTWRATLTRPFSASVRSVEREFTVVDGVARELRVTARRGGDLLETRPTATLAPSDADRTNATIRTERTTARRVLEWARVKSPAGEPAASRPSQPSEAQPLRPSQPSEAQSAEPPF